MIDPRTKILDWFCNWKKVTTGPLLYAASSNSQHFISGSLVVCMSPRLCSDFSRSALIKSACVSGQQYPGIGSLSQARAATFYLFVSKRSCLHCLGQGNAKEPGTGGRGGGRDWVFHPTLPKHTESLSESLSQLAQNWNKKYAYLRWDMGITPTQYSQSHMIHITTE